MNRKREPSQHLAWMATPAAVRLLRPGSMSPTWFGCAAGRDKITSTIGTILPAVASLPTRVSERQTDVEDCSPRNDHLDEMTMSDKYLVNCSYGKDDPEKATIAFILAFTSSKANEAVVFATAEAAELLLRNNRPDIRAQGCESFQSPTVTSGSPSAR